MKTLKIACYSALKNCKDIKTHLFIVVLPILLIIILGMALDPYHSPQNLDAAEVAYLNDDQGEAATQLQAFLESEQIRELIHLLPVADDEEGRALLDNGSVESFLHIPAGFSAALYSGESVSIQLLSNQSMPIVKTLVENYIIGVNGAFAAISLGGTPTAPNGGRHIEPVPITTDGKVPRALDYYAVQTLLQVLILGALFGISAMREDEEQNTAVRIKSAPVKTWEIITGRTAAGVTVLFAQALIVMAFSSIVYQANWGGSMLVNLGILFLFVLFVIGMGMLLGVLIQNSVAGIAALWGVMIVFSTTGGAFGGTVNDTLAKLSPNHYAATAIFNNIFAGSPEGVRSSALTLGLATVAVYLLTYIIGRRRFA